MRGLQVVVVPSEKTNGAPKEIGTFHEAPGETGWQQRTEPFRRMNRFTPGR
jgi:hypothetical protein